MNACSIVVDQHIQPILPKDNDTYVPRMYFVYMITNIKNNKKYFGISTNPTQRFRQHASRPPSRMVKDLSDVSFWDIMTCEVIQGYENKRNAERRERQLILQHQTFYAKAGYNILTCKPGWSKLFWLIRRTKKHTPN
jgi:predicted GIY-YIG superfamily endonuclease